MNGKNLKNMQKKICKQCNEILPTNTTKSKTFCNQRCADIYRRQQKYNDKIEGYDYIICPVCNLKMGEITLTHVISHGFENIEAMKKHFDLKSLKCQKLIDKMVGKNNPGYQHGGKLSPWSNNNPNSTKESINNSKKKAVENMKGKRPSEVQYWIDKGYTEDEAILKRKESQTTFSLDICIEKYGEVEGRERWKQRQEKWLKSYPKQNFSKISQELFWKILEYIDGTNDIYFATKQKDGTKSTSNNNYEYRLCLDDKCVMPDFIDISKKCIIEFDGEYWHSESRANPEREKQRDNSLINSGYKILHIFEKDYRENPEKEIEKCVNFLKQ